MMSKQIGLYHSDTHPYDPADYVLEKPDMSYLSEIVEIDGQRWIVKCGLIFCSTCEQCMACSDEDCLLGSPHAWPEGWQELVERAD